MDRDRHEGRGEHDRRHRRSDAAQNGAPPRPHAAAVSSAPAGRRGRNCAPAGRHDRNCARADRPGRMCAPAVARRDRRRARADHCAPADHCAQAGRCATDVRRERGARPSRFAPGGGPACTDRRPPFLRAGDAPSWVFSLHFLLWVRRASGPAIRAAGFCRHWTSADRCGTRCTSASCSRSTALCRNPESRARSAQGPS